MISYDWKKKLREKLELKQIDLADDRRKEHGDSFWS